MEIGPVKNNRPIQPSADEAGKPQKVAEPASRPGDRIEISENARHKLAELADRAVLQQMDSSGTYSRSAGADTRGVDEQSTSGPAAERSTRLDEVRKRMAAGFYDRPDVVRKIAEKLADDLNE